MNQDNNMMNQNNGMISPNGDMNNANAGMVPNMQDAQMQDPSMMNQNNGMISPNGDMNNLNAGMVSNMQNVQMQDPNMVNQVQDPFAVQTTSQVPNGMGGLNGQVLNPQSINETGKKKNNLPLLLALVGALVIIVGVLVMQIQGANLVPSTPSVPQSNTNTNNNNTSNTDNSDNSGTSEPNDVVTNPDSLVCSIVNNDTVNNLSYTTEVVYKFTESKLKSYSKRLVVVNNASGTSTNSDNSESNVTSDAVPVSPAVPTVPTVPGNTTKTIESEYVLYNPLVVSVNGYELTATLATDNSQFFVDLAVDLSLFDASTMDELHKSNEFSNIIVTLDDSYDNVKLINTNAGYTCN